MKLLSQPLPGTSDPSSTHTALHPSVARRPLGKVAFCHQGSSAMETLLDAASTLAAAEPIANDAGDAPAPPRTPSSAAHVCQDGGDEDYESPSVQEAMAGAIARHRGRSQLRQHALLSADRRKGELLNGLDELPSPDIPYDPRACHPSESLGCTSDRSSPLA